MTPYIELLKKRYKDGLTTKETLDTKLSESKITQEEYNYIMAD